jgi:hypothetical protein
LQYFEVAVAAGVAFHSPLYALHLYAALCWGEAVMLRNGIRKRVLQSRDSKNLRFKALYKPPEPEVGCHTETCFFRLTVVVQVVMMAIVMIACISLIVTNTWPLNFKSE